MASQYSFSGLCPLLYARCSLFILSWRSLYFLFLGGGVGSPLLHDIIEFDVRSSSALIFLIKYHKLGCFLPTSVFHLLLNAENIPAKSMMWNVSFFLSHTKTCMPRRHKLENILKSENILNSHGYTEMLKYNWLKTKILRIFFCWAKHFLYGAGPWFIPDEHCSFTTEHCHNKVIFREHMLSKNARKSIFATFF